ncbi:MAG: hypothetical protein HY833_01095 [Candidatus Aenigmarchaeota archaeon]|nr:hypothetical protein [Candidatus Aenigmarchaeota archaeon]
MAGENTLLQFHPYSNPEGKYRPNIITKMLAKIRPVRDETYIFQRQIGARNTGILEFGIDFEKRLQDYKYFGYDDVPIEKAPAKEPSSEKIVGPVPQPSVQAAPDDAYKSFLTMLDKIIEGQNYRTDNILATMYQTNQDNQAAETARHKETIESLTKALYQTGQEHERTVQGIVQEISRMRSDYVEMQAQYQHLVKEMGDQVSSVIRSYEQEHAKERGFLMEILSEQRKSYESVLDKNDGAFKSYVQEQMKMDKERTAAIMEMNQRNFNALTDAVEKIIGYKQKPASTKKTYAKKGGKRPGMGTLSSQLAELIDINKKILDNTADSAVLEKKMVSELGDTKKTLDEYLEKNKPG